MEHMKEIPFRPTSGTERTTARLLLIGIVFILLGSLFVIRECSPNQEPALNIEERL